MVVSMFRFYDQCSGELVLARLHCEGGGGGGFCWGWWWWFCFPSNFKIKLKLFSRWTCCCSSPLWGWSWFDSLPTPHFRPNRSRLSFFLLLANLSFRPLSTQQIQVEFFWLANFFDLPIFLICQFSYFPIFFICQFFYWLQSEYILLHWLLLFSVALNAKHEIMQIAKLTKENSRKEHQ